MLDFWPQRSSGTKLGFILLDTDSLSAPLLLGSSATSMSVNNNVETTTSPTTGAQGGSSCCAWLRAEIACHCCTGLPTTTWFGLVDAPNGQTIDLQASFQCKASRKVLVYKGMVWAWIVASLAYGWQDSPYAYFFPAYVTIWTYFYSTIYLTLSLLVSLVVSPTSTTTTANWIIKATWVMYLVAALHNCLVVPLFWATEYDPATYTLNYFVVFSHAGSFVLTLVDGLWVNKIPVRVAHYVFAMGFALLFVAWSLIQGLVPVDNPSTINDDDDSDVLYGILDWKDPTSAAILCVLIVFVFFPLLTLALWGLSLWGRRYVATTATPTATTDKKDGGQGKGEESADEVEDVEGGATAQVY